MDNKNFHDVSIMNIWTAYRIGMITFARALEKIRLLN